MSDVVFVLVEDEVFDRNPLAGFAEEVLLAGGAHEVGVGVAVAHVLERFLPAEQLISGLDVDFRILF
jgi:hypothetical protein